MNSDPLRLLLVPRTFLCTVNTIARNSFFLDSNSQLVLQPGLVGRVLLLRALFLSGAPARSFQLFDLFGFVG
jgi:hypothetical protein